MSTPGLPSHSYLELKARIGRRVFSLRLGSAVDMLIRRLVLNFRNLCTSVYSPPADLAGFVSYCFTFLHGGSILPARMQALPRNGDVSSFPNSTSPSFISISLMSCQGTPNIAQLLSCSCLVLVNLNFPPLVHAIYPFVPLTAVSPTVSPTERI